MFFQTAPIYDQLLIEKKKSWGVCRERDSLSKCVSILTFLLKS